MLELNPIDDGMTHLNVYSKAATQIGKDLTNFSSFAVTIPAHGRFASMEGYWVWLRLSLLPKGSVSEESLEPLHKATGYEAKAISKQLLPAIKTFNELLFNNYPHKEFREGIKKALRLRFSQNTDLRKRFYETTLPLTHYYYYGKADNCKVVEPKGNEFVLEELNTIRVENACKTSRCFVARLYGPDDNVLVRNAESFKTFAGLSAFMDLYNMMNVFSGWEWDEVLDARVRDLFKGLEDDPFTERLNKAKSIWEFIYPMFYVLEPENKALAKLGRIDIVSDNGTNINRAFSLREQ